MKQFELEKINFGFGPQAKKNKNPKNIESYMLNIQKKNKETHRHQAIDFNALIVGYKDEDMIKLHHCKLSIKKEGTHQLKENFYKDKDTTTDPIVIFYKKKHDYKHLNQKLIDDLYMDLNHIYSEYKNNLSKVTDKESLQQHEIDYQKNIERLAIKLFSSLEKTSHPAIIEGVILNKFYIGHHQGRFFIQDTDKSFLDEKVNTNKYDSFLTKRQSLAPSIPSNLDSKASGLIIDYKNNLQSKHDRTTLKTAKDEIQKEINLTVSLHSALFNRNNKDFQSALQALKKNNEEKHSKFKYKLLSKFHFKPKKVRIIENIEALTQPRPLVV